jgi:hypothetical protein
MSTPRISLGIGKQRCSLCGEHERCVVVFGRPIAFCVGCVRALVAAWARTVRASAAVAHELGCINRAESVADGEDEPPSGDGGVA